MLEKVVIATACAVFATGCAVPSHYLPVSAETAHLKIRGELIGMADIKIFINDEKVIDDKLALLSGAGAFRGAYGGKEVTVDCSSKAGLVADKTRCAVFVDNHRASILAF